MPFIGTPLALQNRQIVEGTIRLGKLLFFITGGFTGSAADAAGKINQDTHAFRISFKCPAGPGLATLAADAAQSCHGAACYRGAQEFSPTDSAHITAPRKCGCMLYRSVAL